MRILEPEASFQNQLDELVSSGGIKAELTRPLERSESYLGVNHDTTMVEVWKSHKGF